MAQQIQKKFIQSNAVDEEKILLSNAGSIRMLNSGASEVDLISLNGSDQVTLLGQLALTAADKGVANGVATLDGSGLIPSAQLPSYVDDVLEFADLASFPGTGETGKIYIAIDTGLAYRWTGSVYAEISSGPADTDALAEGSTNLYFTEARAIGSVITGFVSGSGTVAATDTILEAIQKLDGNIAAATLSSTDDLAEGVTNFYYTEARFDSSLSGKSTDDLAEGATNLYYTEARFDSSLSGKTSDDLTEGATNLFYSEARFDTSLSGKTTDDIVEGTNLYYTDARVDANTSVVLNTAKVSADGSIGTHSDVDVSTAAPVNGDVLTWNGANWVPLQNGDYTSSDFDSDFGLKTTDDLTEGGANLYFTEDRTIASILINHVASGDGTNVVANTDSIEAAIGKLDGAVIDHESRVAALEAGGANLTWAKERFVLAAGDITNGYIELAQEAAANSIVAFVDRLAIHEGASEDYSVSVPVAVTRMTFLNSLVSPGNQQLAAGDVINVTYQY